MTHTRVIMKLKPSCAILLLGRFINKSQSSTVHNKVKLCQEKPLFNLFTNFQANSNMKLNITTIAS